MALCEGNPMVTGGFPHKRPVMRRFDDFCVVSLIKLLNKQSSCRCFETPLHSWNVTAMPERLIFMTSTTTVHLKPEWKFPSKTLHWRHDGHDSVSNHQTAQMASKAEYVSIWWLHHEHSAQLSVKMMCVSLCVYFDTAEPSIIFIYCIHDEFTLSESWFLCVIYVYGYILICLYIVHRLYSLFHCIYDLNCVVWLPSLYRHFCIDRYYQLSFGKYQMNNWLHAIFVLNKSQSLIQVLCYCHGAGPSLL